MLLAFLCTLFGSCQNDARWYPTADVIIENQYEYTDLTGSKQLLVTCVVHNTGDTSINGGNVTLQVKTDARKYLQTIAVTTRIIPGGKIAVNATIEYLDSNEQVLSGGVSVYAGYFD